jgi:hypothetical protein
MMLQPIIGYAAILSAWATIGTFITGMLFFLHSPRLGRVNDIASVVQLLLMLPVVPGTFLLTRHHAPILAWPGLAIGLIGVLTAAYWQGSLVFDARRYEQAGPAALKAGALIGLWLFAIGAGGLAVPLHAIGLSVLAIIAGVGYMILVIGFMRGAQSHPLFMAGSGLALVGYTAWAFWLGRMLLDGRVMLAW